MDQFRALSGADMSPASVAAIVVLRAPMVFADQVPDQRRVLEGTLLQAVPLIPSHGRCAKSRLALFCSDVLAAATDLQRRGQSSVDISASHRSPDRSHERQGFKRVAEAAPSCLPEPPATPMGGLARQHPAQPGARMEVSLGDHAVGADDPQAPRGSLAHLHRGPEPLFAARRMLPGGEPAPSGKVPAFAEYLWQGRQRGEGRGRQGAMPGIVIRRRATWLPLARRRVSASSVPIPVPRCRSAATSTSSVARASAGRPRPGSSIIAISRATLPAPCGTIWPYSPRCPRAGH